jgi:hypothetical protein
MSVLLAMPVSGGGTIVVEADDDINPPAVVRAARPGEVVREAAQSLEDALDSTLRPVAAAFLSALGHIRPDEAELNLGLKISAEAGVIVSKLAAEASLQVKLIWRTSGGET